MIKEGKRNKKRDKEYRYIYICFEEKKNTFSILNQRTSGHFVPCWFGKVTYYLIIRH